MNLRFNFAALPPRVHYAVGVDGGGTSTRARVLHRSGETVGEGRAGASGLVQGVAQAWLHIGQAIVQATQGRLQPGWQPPTPENTALGIGLAGANVAPWRTQFLEADPGYARLVVESDATTALVGAHGGRPGALVILGTGSIGVACDARGHHRTVGGWGFPSGDEGSGAWLGLRAMARTQWAVDGRSPHSPLTRALFARLGATPDALLAWCTQANQHAYASLAPLVFEHEGDDPLAHALLQEAVLSLQQLAHALDPDQALPLALGGSIAQRLASRLPAPLAARVVTPAGDAMDGGLALCFTP
ncbi:BadF/BadG/BcrA/BcrD ATPase family protein [Curvibacter sp. APW13]|uniref:BadF/BadG/BcrA/BcrD ATPase family protein n=1 Tax=Curvibacter sp. APW13 TaxID=3077236 RepID=UPI0028E08387|nr:BadF/BadG/BcrA/BcrD ATPase family protein [Curvibacter sp. APW13]MDT8991032.1 BadF/BadG/BcrA/BcrD ATPase family protein [Curvibacter sp. APW13]